MRPMIPERRKYERYETDLKLYFSHILAGGTKVEYQLLDKAGERPISDKYPGLSKNVSAEGLSFVANQQLKKGDYLNLEIYLPTATEPVIMEGEVRWSQAIPQDKEAKPMFQTGVLLKKVNGEAVDKSIYFYHEYRLHWSNVLESLLDKFKNIAKKNKK